MRWLNAVALLMAVTLTGASSDTLPGDSIYQLRLAMTTQDGSPAGLDRDRGRPVLISMFYSNCPYVCPLIIETIQRMERGLSDAQRGRLGVMLITLDPARDTPPVLAEMAQRRNVDLSRWTLARVNDCDVRKIAAVLGIQYRKLPDGNFNHATAIILLDTDGRILARTEKLGEPPTDFMDKLRDSL
jgi:protein SCO1/2